MAGREQAIAALKAAYVQGRLTKEEFDVRVGQAPRRARRRAPPTSRAASLSSVRIRRARCRRPAGVRTGWRRHPPNRLQARQDAPTS
jgi:hypothetical protein